MQAWSKLTSPEPPWYSDKPPPGDRAPRTWGNLLRVTTCRLQGHNMSPHSGLQDHLQCHPECHAECHQPRRQCCCSVSKLCLTLQPHGLQHARLPYLSLSPRVCSNSCPLSQWCHPTISSSVTLFSSCPQSFPASGSFPISRLFASGYQSIGASASVLPMNIEGWFPLWLIGLILQSKGLSRVFSSTTVWKYQFFGAHPSLWSNSRIRIWLQEKP